MTQWATFAGLTGVVCALLLLLSHATTHSLTGPDDADTPTRTDAAGSDSSASEPAQTAESTRSSHDPSAEPRSLESSTEPRSNEPPTGRVPERDGARAAQSNLQPPESMSTGALLANVALSQGLFAAVLIGAAVYTAVPASALGIEFSQSYLLTGLLVGVGVGVVLAAVNELGSVAAARRGVDPGTELRELLAPETRGGWLVLLVVVLPVIALFEEFLFRAALIGALSVGFGVSPWLLAVVSSLAFALGHGIQGRVGILVTGTLGFVLAAVFILTESLLTVVVAHYLVNAFEFVLHEGTGLEWSS
ncbi:CPBP family glutamic-type intramembrane protease [Natronobiforma cellulositropha]|uniref:CPBP family glutamic-type intramembrane protease n=1 Tax=Natronobiforma cellulositropha TaxID=1679076 RepID=UPI0021D5EA96|nr:CPBP family glutamic-type intramembrane protease [Natronobiforma cellulositropha]